MTRELQNPAGRTGGRGPANRNSWPAGDDCMLMVEREFFSALMRRDSDRILQWTPVFFVLSAASLCGLGATLKRLTLFRILRTECHP